MKNLSRQQITLSLLEEPANTEDAPNVKFYTKPSALLRVRHTHLKVTVIFIRHKLVQFLIFSLFQALKALSRYPEDRFGLELLAWLLSRSRSRSWGISEMLAGLLDLWSRDPWHCWLLLSKVWNLHSPQAWLDKDEWFPLGQVHLYWRTKMSCVVNKSRKISFPNRHYIKKLFCIFKSYSVELYYSSGRYNILL